MPDSMLSNYLGNAMLQRYLVTDGGWLAIHLSDPTALGLLDTELAGADYLRQRVLFHDAASKTVASSNAQRFTGLPAGRAYSLAVWNAVAVGQLLFRIPLDPYIDFALNANFLAAPGDVALTL